MLDALQSFKVTNVTDHIKYIFAITVYLKVIACLKVTLHKKSS